METEYQKLIKCKTIVECARLLKGVDYTNGRIRKEIIDYCLKEYGIDIIEVIRKNNRHFCLVCGAEIPLRRKFCSSSCAAKYNNQGRILSDETKDKISNSIKTTYDKKGRTGKRVFECVCRNCGKTFFSHKQSKFCSHKCSNESEETKEKIRKKALERIENGTFSGWKTRGKRSYPEKFWENVLNNNGISFIPEDFSTKKYFLDFLIEKNGKKIDLEIDGKQHKERKEHDIERDSFLTENGFIVYRVKWNSINSEVGKTKMKEKIDKFLEFYNRI